MSQTYPTTKKRLLAARHPVKPQWKQKRDRRAVRDLLSFLLSLGCAAIAFFAVKLYIPSVIALLRRLSS